MRGKLHRMKVLMLSIAIAAGICAGCGEEYTDPSRDGAVSGGVVSGSAISGGAVSGQAVTPENNGNSREERQNANYCTDTNLYVEGDDESEGYYVVQMRLDGTRKKWIEIPGFVELISVEENGLFCTCEDDYENESLCWIPIEKGEDGFDAAEYTERATPNDR